MEGSGPHTSTEVCLNATRFYELAYQFSVVPQTRNLQNHRCSIHHCNRNLATHNYFFSSLAFSNCSSHTHIFTQWHPVDVMDGSVLDDSPPLPPMLSDITYLWSLLWRRKRETQFHLISPTDTALTFIHYSSVSMFPPDLLFLCSPLVLSFFSHLHLYFSFCCQWLFVPFVPPPNSHTYFVVLLLT